MPAFVMFLKGLKSIPGENIIPGNSSAAYKDEKIVQDPFVKLPGFGAISRGYHPQQVITYGRPQHLAVFVSHIELPRVIV